MQEYYDRAKYLVDHGQLNPDAFRPPAYPVFLAGLLRLFGDRAVIAARVVQAILGAVSIGLTGLIARQVAGPRATILAATIVAFYPAWLIYPVYLVAESLFTFLTLLGIWLWSLRRWWAVVMAGITLAIAMQTRAVGIATIAGLSIAAAIDIVGGLRRPREHTPTAPTTLAAQLTLLIVAFALAMTPWVGRNLSMFGRLIPTDTASGWNFLLGNNPLATGRLELDHIPIVAQQYWSRATTDVERSTIGMQAGMAFIRAEPGQSAALAVKKLGYLVGLEGREHAWTYSNHYHGRRSPAVIWMWGLAILISFPVLMIAAATGAFRPGLSRTTLGVALLATLVFVALVHIGSFGESRFHVPWIPVLAIFASRLTVPLDRRWPLLRRSVFALAMVTLISLWISQAPGLVHRLALLASSPTPLALPY